MNKVQPSPKRRRSYDNSLREEQARQTRQRILEAALEEIVDAGDAGVTLARVARAAGVSEPTLYRHFGSRERLFEAIEKHAQGRLGLPAFPETAGELPAQVRALFARFEAHAPLLGAMLQTGVGKELRSRGRARRTRQLRGLIEARAPQLDAAAVDRVLGVLRVLVSWESFGVLTGELGMSTSEASAAVGWALETLMERVGEMDGAGSGPGTATATQDQPGDGE